VPVNVTDRRTQQHDIKKNGVYQLGDLSVRASEATLPKPVIGMFALRVYVALAFCSVTSFSILLGVSSGNRLERISPNGTVEPIGPPLSGAVLAPQVSCVDSETYFVVGVRSNGTTSYTCLIGVSVESGEATSEHVLPFANQGFVGLGLSLACDQSTHRVIIGGQLILGGAHVIGWVDVSGDGRFKAVASVPATYADFPGGGQGAYNHVTHTLLVQLGTAVGQPVLAVVNMESGKVSKRTPEPLLFLGTPTHVPNRQLLPPVLCNRSSCGLRTCSKAGTFSPSTLTRPRVSKHLCWTPCAPSPVPALNCIYWHWHMRGSLVQGMCMASASLPLTARTTGPSSSLTP
jgi:hypothetical protein